MRQPCSRPASRSASRLDIPRVRRPHKFKEMVLALLFTTIATSTLESRQSWAQAEEQQKLATPEYHAVVKSSSPYLLGPKDKVRVRVVEWRASQGEVFEWKVVNLEYVVDAEGSISVPLIGSIPAAGMTKAELSKTISARLRKTLGLASSPDVALEIVQCRPFYVMGNINKPGEYAYRPGMTVLQAISIAGGYLTQRNPRDAINDENELRGAVSGLGELSARKERLIAELQGRVPELGTQASTNAGVEPAAVTQSSLAQEKWIYDANQESERKELSFLQELKYFYFNQITVLESRLKVDAKIVENGITELRDVSALVKRGLTTRQRELQAELQKEQREAEMLRVQSELIQARQGLSKTLMAAAQIESKRRIRAAADLRSTQADINRMEERAELRSKLLIYAGSGAVQQTFRIVRQTETGTKRLEVSDTEAMQPGDVLEVNVELRTGTEPLETRDVFAHRLRRPTWQDAANATRSRHE